jgi:hypothetical protein
MVARTGDDRLRRIYAKKADGSFVEISATDSGMLQMQASLSTKNVEVEFARPSDTTAYTAKDVVGNTGVAAVITFADAARVNGGAGNIVKGRLFTNSATAMLGAVLRLHLYKESPTAIADNAPFTLLYANRSKRIGYIDFPALATEGTGSDASSALWVDIPLNFTTAASDTNLYGVLEVVTVGAAPASAQNFTVALNIEQY